MTVMRVAAKRPLVVVQIRGSSVTTMLRALDALLGLPVSPLEQRLLRPFAHF